MILPNFLIIGAAKSGTDALNAFLQQHPQIYMSPVREPMFFVADGQEEIPYRGPRDRETLWDHEFWVHSLTRYEALFADVSTEKAIGESSNWYIYDDHAYRRIRQYVPHARLIAILRNPVDRAYSAYTMLIRDGRERIRDFPSALAAENDRIHANWEPLWHYQRMGFYYAQLKRYYDMFDRDQIRVVLYDDFDSRPNDVVRELFRFLKVDGRFEPDTSTRRNVSMVPKNFTYHELIAGENALKSMVKFTLPTNFRRRLKVRLLAPNFTNPAPLAPEVRQQLVDVFRPDILQLQTLIDRDLSHWLR